MLQLYASPDLFCKQIRAISTKSTLVGGWNIASQYEIHFVSEIRLDGAFVPSKRKLFFMDQDIRKVDKYL